MATKIRLQRFGKKGKPFYHVVVADGRAPRDGKFIERIGSYNPNTNPATIDLNFDKALDWMNKGAQPTDTCRGILSVKGVLYKKHLQGGLRKGALTEEQVESKFNEWVKSREGKISGEKDNLVKSKQDARQAALAAEAKKKEDRAAAIVAKNTPPADETAEEPVEDGAAETPAIEAEQETEAAATIEEPSAKTEEKPATEESTSPEAIAPPVADTTIEAEPVADAEKPAAEEAK